MSLDPGANCEVMEKLGGTHTSAARTTKHHHDITRLGRTDLFCRDFVLSFSDDETADVCVYRTNLVMHRPFAVHIHLSAEGEPSLADI